MLHAYAETNNILNILYHPGILHVNKKQIQQLENIKSLLDNFNFLNKFYDQEFKIYESENLYNFVAPIIGSNKSNEMVIMVCLNNAHGIIHHEIVANGLLDSCEIDFRKMVKVAVNSDAKKVIFAHNHPSGDLQFSVPDIETTKKFISILAPIGIEVLDHLVVNHKTFISMGKANIIDFQSSHQQHAVSEYKQNKKPLKIKM